MAEFALNLKLLAVGFEEFAAETRKLERAFSDYVAAIDPLWATLPGAWPDNFTLLNRYLRTGVKPEWLFNERPESRLLLR